MSRTLQVTVGGMLSTANGRDWTLNKYSHLCNQHCHWKSPRVISTYVPRGVPSGLQSRLKYIGLSTGLLPHIVRDMQVHVCTI